jgi:hypothetical protein
MEDHVVSPAVHAAMPLVVADIRSALSVSDVASLRQSSDVLVCIGDQR